MRALADSRPCVRTCLWCTAFAPAIPSGLLFIGGIFGIPRFSRRLKYIKLDELVSGTEVNHRRKLGSNELRQPQYPPIFYRSRGPSASLKKLAAGNYACTDVKALAAPAKKVARCVTASGSEFTPSRHWRIGKHSSLAQRHYVGPDLFRAACNIGLEGIVSKRADRPYRAGRSPAGRVFKRRNPLLLAATRRVR